MPSNPNSAIGTNAAYEGRTSANAFNDGLAFLSRGVLSGWGCVPSSGMTVAIGGVSGERDVAIAEDNVGNKTTINNISTVPISVTIDTAPVSNSRIDSIVLYVDNPPQGNSTDADNPGACGMVVVKGTVAASPVAPDDNAIRAAITADGGNGTAAYYVVIANITITTGTTIITQNLIETTSLANPLGYSLVESETSLKWLNGKKIYKKTAYLGTFPNATRKQVPYNIANLEDVIKIEGFGYRASDKGHFPLPYPSPYEPNVITITVDGANEVFEIATGNDRTNMIGYVTIYYTKSS